MHRLSKILNKMLILTSKNNPKKPHLIKLLPLVIIPLGPNLPQPITLTNLIIIDSIHKSHNNLRTKNHQILIPYHNNKNFKIDL